MMGSTADMGIFNFDQKFLDKHRSFLSQFWFRYGLKSEIEEISQKFKFLLKDTASKQFLIAFGALNERPARNGIRKCKNG